MSEIRSLRVHSLTAITQAASSSARRSSDCWISPLHPDACSSTRLEMSCTVTMYGRGRNSGTRASGMCTSEGSCFRANSENRIRSRGSVSTRSYGTG